MALGLSEGTGIFCSAEGYIIARSIVIRDAFTPANLSIANYVKMGIYTLSVSTKRGYHVLFPLLV